MKQISPGENGAEMMTLTGSVPIIWTPHSLALVGLEAVHVVGASDAPGAQELQQVDLHWGLHEHKIVLRHPEAGTMEEESMVKDSGEPPNSVLKNPRARTCARRRA